jgi:hypothetical protein
MKIATGLQYRTDPLAQSLYRLGFDWEQLEAFGDSLARSMRPSVDAFLEHRPEFVDCGKAAIAAALIPCEDPKQVLDRSESQSWYEYLFGKLAAHQSDFIPGRLAILIIAEGESNPEPVWKWELGSSHTCGFHA